MPTAAAIALSTWNTLQARRSPPPARQRPPQRSAAEIIAEGRAALAIAEAPPSGAAREALITRALETTLTPDEITEALKLPAAKARDIIEGAPKWR